MTKRILIMGLPGAGKTTLAMELQKQLHIARKTVTWFNADAVRRENNDWDFSETGRIRQSIRMRDLSDAATGDYTICDFVAPLAEMRGNIDADWTIWVDTIDEGRFADTNKIFVNPTTYNFRVTTQDAVKWAESICNHILKN